MSSKITSTDEFIVKAKEIHNTKYDYSKSHLITMRTKLTIICPIHGEFEQIPYDHLRGYGCRFCANDKNKDNCRYTTNHFIEQARLVHGDKYDYSKVQYINSKTKVIIIDEFGLEHKQISQDHLTGNKLTIENALNKNEYFIAKSKQVHGNKYNYSKVNYINNRTKLIIICPEHGEFTQVSYSHMGNIGCPTCRNSKGEKIINKILVENNIMFIPQHTFSECKDKNKLPFDFYLPDLNTCIEFNGEQHYKVVEYFGGLNKLTEQRKHDKIKKDYCKNNNIALLVIKYDDDIISKLSNIIY